MVDTPHDLSQVRHHVLDLPRSPAHQFLKAVRPGNVAKSWMALLSARADPVVKFWLAKIIWSRPLDALSLSFSAGRNSLISEDLVEGQPDEVFNLRFRKTELYDRNLTPALASLCNRMFASVDRMDSRTRWTIHPHVDSHDGVAIAIDLGKLIEARSIQDGFGPIWTKFSSLDFHGPDISSSK